ncbi:MAG: sugar transferase [Bdellovibrionota bacterium]
MSATRNRRQGFSKLLLSASVVPWIFADFWIGFGVFYACALLGRMTDLQQVRIDNAVAAGTLSFFFLLVGLASGFFDRENRLKRFEIVKLGLISWGLAVALGLAVLHFLFFMVLGRFSLIYGSLGALLAILGFHFLVTFILRKYPHRFLILGPMSAGTLEILRWANRGTDHYEHADALRKQIEENPSLPPSEVAELIENDQIVDLVLSLDPSSPAINTAIASLALQHGVRVVDEGRFFSELYRRYPLESLPATWIVTEGFDIHKPVTNIIKRTVDFLGAIVMLIVLSPLLLVIGLSIWLTSPGSAFYTQIRQGRYSKPFRMLKFRSMTANHAGSEATSPDDLRVTAVGKIIRPLHFDELPQLVNILIGQMSFVGPRPEALQIVERTREKLPIFEIRHMVRPGLTGLAQISQGKTQDGLEEITTKLSFDLYYLRNYGLALDLLIALRTAFVLTRKTW